MAVGGYFSAKKIFGGGLDRLLNIEDAQAKLKGLGHDAAAVATIMTSALDAVRGTAYGLDSAATVAASAVAAGIKPGQQLTKYLQLTADAATIAGTSMDEMGSIMNKVTSSGFAMTDNLNQLADRGIPIFQWLQDEYGVTSEELRKMVSKGKVDAETFNRVISENIGGAALASGDTTRGAMANMGAALSRVGANLMAGVFPLFKSVFQGITTMLGPIEDGAKRVGAAFGTWTMETLIPAAQSLGGVLSGLSETIQGIAAVIRDGDFNGALFEWLGVQEDAPLIDTLFRVREAAQTARDVLTTGGAGSSLAAMMDIAPAVGPLMWFRDTAQLAMDAISGIGTAWDLLVTGGSNSSLADLINVGGAIDPILALRDTLSIFGDAAKAYITPVAEAFGGIWESLAPIVPQVMDAVGAFNPLGLIFKALVPILPQIAGLIGQLAGTFVTALAPILAAVVPLLAQVASVLVEGLTRAFVSVLPAVTSLLPVITSLVGIVGGVLLTVVQALTPVILLLADMFVALLPTIMSLITPAIGIVKALLPIVAIVGDLIGALLPPLVDLFMALLKPILDLIAPLVGALAPILETVGTLISTLLVPWLTTLAGWFTKLVTFLAPVITAIASGLVGALSSLIQWILKAVGPITSFATDAIDAIARFASSVGDSIGSAIQWFRDLPGMIGDAVSGAGTWLKDTGKKIIDGLVEGFKSAFKNVKDTLGGLTDMLPDWKGPARRDAKLLYGSGQLVIGGFVKGLESKYGSAESSLGAFTDGLAGAGTAALSASLPKWGGENASAIPAGVALAGDTYNITTDDPVAAALAVSRRQIARAAV